MGANTSEPMYAITPKLQVPISRFIEWLQGIRPLPGQDEIFFFRTAVDTRFLSEQEAANLRDRHHRLNRLEAGEGEPAEEIPADLAAELIRLGWTPPLPDRLR